MKNLILLRTTLGGDNYTYFIITFSNDLLKIRMTKSKCEHEHKGFAYPNPLKIHKILKKYYHN